MTQTEFRDRFNKEITIYKAWGVYVTNIVVDHDQAKQEH